MCCKLSLKSIFLGEKWKKKIFVLIQCLKSGKEAENTKKKLTSQAGIRTRFARTKLGLSLYQQFYFFWPMAEVEKYAF